MCCTALNETIFTFQIHHNGEFTSTPGRRYLFGDTDWFDGVHCDIFSMDLLGEMLEDLGYTDRTLLFTHFRIPDESLDDGLLPLKSDEDVRRLVEYVPIFTELELYIETGVSVVECEMTERMMTKGKGVVIEEIVDHNVNDAVGKDVDGETGNTGKLLLLEWHKEWHKTSQPEKAGPLYDTDSDNDFLPIFCAEKMIANHSKRLSDEFQFRSGKEGDLHTWISDKEVDQGIDVDWNDDPYPLVDVPKPEEMYAVEEPQEISDMFVEIDQALDELNDVVAAEEGTEIVCDEAVIPDDQCAEVVGDGEQRVCDGAVIQDNQCVVVVGEEGCISVVDGDVIKDKVVAKQGDKPDEVLEKMELGKMECVQRKSLKTKEDQSRGED
ncbi:hypothetical protein CTI12_AA175090 [Artemisia annua]|uniref:PB1-like domain-containing protein n=1 Tax=Artemisia annua TaxID=35608 RepID=A0A2U1PAP3_ARTAN|nr:hypothetical protein CTI12_AA175090 [Artemisia annua]